MAEIPDPTPTTPPDLAPARSPRPEPAPEVALEPGRGGVRFSRAGVRRGAMAALPLLVGLVPFGVVVGVVSAGKGLLLTETLLMSALVYAGAAQLMVLELWTDPAPILAATLAAGVVNIRMAPMAAALSGWLDRLRGIRLWGTLATLVDHSFAMSIADMRAGGRDAGYLLGIGLALWVIWLATVCTGYLLGGVVHLPPGHPLLFAGVATFTALLVSLWRGARHDVLPWIAAAAVALTAQRLSLPPPLPLLSGALSGAAIAAWQEVRRARAPRVEAP